MNHEDKIEIAKKEYASKVESELQKLKMEILEKAQFGEKPLKNAAEGLGAITIKLHQMHNELSKDKPEIDQLLTEIAAIYVRTKIETHY